MEKINREVLDSSVTDQNKAITLHNLGICAQYLGELDKALDSFQRSLKLPEPIGNPADIAKSLGQLSFLYRQKQEPRRALGYIARSVALRHKLHPPLLRQVMSNLLKIALEVEIWNGKRFW